MKVKCLFFIFIEYRRIIFNFNSFFFFFFFYTYIYKGNRFSNKNFTAVNLIQTNFRNIEIKRLFPRNATRNYYSVSESVSNLIATNFKCFPFLPFPLIKSCSDMIRMKAIQWANNWSNNFYIELATSTRLLLNKNESIYLCYAKSVKYLIRKR